MAFPETYFTPDDTGQIYAMAGATRAHGLIVSNCIALLWPQLRGEPCEVHARDRRTRIAATGAYVYPDVTVACNGGSGLRRQPAQLELDALDCVLPVAQIYHQADFSQAAG